MVAFMTVPKARASFGFSLSSADGLSGLPTVQPLIYGLAYQIRTSLLQEIFVSLALFLQGLGSIGVFASRAFLPAFVTALMLRFGPEIPRLGHVGLLPDIRSVPQWFMSDAALVVLGVLSALELVAERSPEARTYLDAVHAYLKAAMAAFTYLGVLNATEQETLDRVIQQAGVVDFVPVSLVAAGTLIATRVRGAVFGELFDTDEDDNLGLQKLLRWVGDLWGAIGPVILIVLPLLTIAMSGLAALALVLIERRVTSLGDRTKVACLGCGQLIHACALICPSCKTPVKEPRTIGLLGRPEAAPAYVATLPFRLVAVKRCPICATRFRKNGVKPTCEVCGHRLMADPAFARDFIGSIDRRVPLTCLLCFGLGLIPVLGVIPGVIYYRLSIVAPFRRYIPPGQGFLLRWAIRLAILVLVACQWIPVAGGFAVPVMALINYGTYRIAYRRLALSP